MVTIGWRHKDIIYKLLAAIGELLKISRKAAKDKGLRLTVLVSMQLASWALAFCQLNNGLRFLAKPRSRKILLYL